MEPMQEKSVITNSSGTFYEKLTCFILPTKVNSLGLLRTLKEQREGLFDYTLPNLEFQLAVMFFLTLALNFYFTKKSLPAIVPEIIAGLLFNPYTLPDWIADRIFTLDSAKTVGTLVAVIYQLFIFQSGVKMEFGMIRSVKGKVLACSIAYTAIPLLVGMTTLALIPSGNTGERTQRSIINDIAASTTYSITSFPVIVSILNDLKLVNSELGRLSLSTALVSDLVSIVLVTITSMVSAAYYGQEGGTTTQFIAVISFIFFVVFMLRPALKVLVGKPNEAKPMKDLHIYLVISLAMGTVFFGKYFIMFVHYGPFIVGLAVPAGSSLGASIVNLFEVVPGYFIPFFITVCAMRTNYKGFYNISEIAPIVTASILIPSTKFLLSFLSQTYVWKMPRNDAIAFGLLTCAKGVVELAMYSYFYDIKVVSDERYAYMILSILVSGGLVPILVKYLYSPTKRYAARRKKNLMNADPDSDLRIIACIHAPGDVRAVLKLLDASCRGDSPLAIDVLHLIKLVAQSTPILIAHHKERAILCNYFYSVNVVRLLNKFEQNNQGSATVNAFTAVSSPLLMYEDICTLALDKHSSLIILPFHVRWNHREGIGNESEDKTTRDLNISVLEKAPCSIGILVDRYKKLASKGDASLSVYTVAMVFLGGADDREALVFSMNMAKDTKVNLTVVQLTAINGSETDYSKASNDELGGMEAKRDHVVLNTAKEREYITFKSEVANDAATTALIIRSMVNEFELIIVGRRDGINENTLQTAGLEEWCEYPELGVLGDLICAQDSKGTCSLLVVQQDQHEAEAGWSTAREMEV